MRSSLLGDVRAHAKRRASLRQVRLLTVKRTPLFTLTGGSQQPTGDSQETHRRLTAAHRRLTAAHRRLTAAHRKVTGGSQQPTGNSQEPTGDSQYSQETHSSPQETHRGEEVPRALWENAALGVLGDFMPEEVPAQECVRKFMRAAGST